MGQVEPRTAVLKPDHQILYDLLTSHITSLLLASPEFSERSAESSTTTSQGGRGLTQELGPKDSTAPHLDLAHSPGWPRLHLTFMGQQSRFKGRTRKRSEGRMFWAWDGQHRNQQSRETTGLLTTQTQAEVTGQW
ncbi:hypothetical protein SKAU_G00321280 [Synaphobranchus kaupii]|uniref:Uncharacterized protein n=1 Tax=Synaphobranchus kaupii TaxID=118154 RepID=A0A9Q1ENQ0_SYNKA|nr:hypothetical protein SKAU_G00321280 [Synaphobranchus kaupii]